ncbi:MAG: family 10 glycosylhydrolase [Bacteroidales bacterium]|nr:family 10 glycosylhydrolase [Bacteroidales bacterium]MBR6306275.1 family 10 glycosylhydrolase [Bacteroidales bacterium]
MIKRLTAYLLMTLALFACTPALQPEIPDEDPSGNQEEQDTPSQDDPKEPETPVGKPRMVWIDASANFYYFANDRDYISTELHKLAECGFTDIVVDVRPTEGTVLWNSSVAPQAKRLAAWIGSKYVFVKRTESWDYLQAFIDAGRDAGLGVYAAINTFVCGYGGYYGLESEGPVFSGDIPAEWAAMDYTADGLKSSYYEGVQGTVFMNPARDDVQEYLLSLLRELASYDIDGIILDRCRYDDTGLQADFSEVSKEKFTDYLGHQPAPWPVFSAGITSLPGTMTPTQRSWLSFRAKTIHDFVEKAADAVHGVNPDVKFGVYVGAWYSQYYSSGVNWASPRYPTHKKYSWADNDYHNYGYADHCDIMLLGCYASVQSIYGTTEWTMQGFASLGKTLLMNDSVCIGGPDIGNPEGWQNGGKSAYIPKTVDAIIHEADGYFAFDLCHIRMYEYWIAFRRAFTDYTNSLTQ